jgi:hypothetical protein
VIVDKQEFHGAVILGASPAGHAISS